MGSSPDEVLQSWRDEDIDYILLYNSLSDEDSIKFGYEFWLDQHDFAYDENSLLLDVLNTNFTPVWDDGFAYVLYEWNE